MARPHPYRDRGRGRVRVRRATLSLADQGRHADHRRALVGAGLLWPEETPARSRGVEPMRKSGDAQLQRRHTLRCAIYTRKSSEEGLEQEFNSLHAQREACEAFIKSQAGEDWRLVKTPYDDGGLSGATMERPVLQPLLAEIKQGLVDVVVVYKVDR